MSESHDAGWSLSTGVREETVRRVTSNLINMIFAEGGSAVEAEAAKTASSIERKAYTVAQAESTTTTGSRPATEVLQAYTRKLATLMLDAVRAHTASQEAPSAAAGTGQASEELDITEKEGEFLTKESAEEKMAAALSGEASIRRLRFSNNSFTPEAAEVAAQAIQRNAATLMHAYMSDIIAGRPEKDALRALQILSSALASARLVALDLSGNALGEKGVRACASVLTSQDALEEVAFENVGLSIRACQALAELLTKPGHLRTLHFRNNMSDDDGAIALAQLVAQAPNLQHFRLASSRVGPAGGIAIASALATGSSLVSLELNDNPFTEEAAPQLGSMLRHHPHLLRLNLSDTSQGDQGIATLAEALSEGAAGLEELELDLNEITPAGASVLGACLVGKRSLKRLSLRENELEDAGAVEIARSLALNPVLEVLDLCANQLTEEGAAAAVQAVVKKQHMKSLELNENQISAQGIRQVKASLKKAGKLGILGSLEDNEADDGDAGSEIDEEDKDADDVADVADADAVAPSESGHQNGTKHEADAGVDALAAAIERTHIQE